MRAKRGRTRTKISRNERSCRKWSQKIIGYEKSLITIKNGSIRRSHAAQRGSNEESLITIKERSWDELFARIKRRPIKSEGLGRGKNQRDGSCWEKGCRKESGWRESRLEEGCPEKGSWRKSCCSEEGCGKENSRQKSRKWGKGQKEGWRAVEKEGYPLGKQESWWVKARDDKDWADLK